jgi:hypothetical protein
VQKTAVGTVKVEDGWLDTTVIKDVITLRWRQVIFTDNQLVNIRFGTQRRSTKPWHNGLVRAFFWQFALAHCTPEFTAVPKCLQLCPNRFPVGVHAICTPKQSACVLAHLSQFVTTPLACRGVAPMHILCCSCYASNDERLPITM